MRKSGSIGMLALAAAFLIVAATGPAADAQNPAPAPAPARAVTATSPAPIEIRFVVIGAMPTETRAWMADMPQTLPFPLGVQPLGYDPDKRILVLTSGVGTNNAAVSTTALGADPRFDLSKAYWLIGAIAGANPSHASIGSAAWIGTILDVDFGKIIDVREAPAAWPNGYPPVPARRPTQPSDTFYPLNAGLRDWAYSLTRTVALPDNDQLRQLRAPFVGYPNAQKPPFVLTGDQISGQGYWHGALLTRRYEALDEAYSEGKSHFVMTAMEDTGVANALRRLSKAGRADYNRLLVLRTGSNYSMQAPGEDAAASMNKPYGPAGQAAFFAAHAVGGPVVSEIVTHWAKYRDAIPSAPAAAQ